MGRPTKFDAEKLDLICRAIEVGATRKIAAYAAGIDVSTLYAWLSKGRNSNDQNDVFKEFSDRIKTAEGMSALRDLSIITRASETDWRAAAWRLERRHGYTVNHQIINESVDIDPHELDVNELMQQIKDTNNLISKLDGPKIDINEK